MDFKKTVMLGVFHSESKDCVKISRLVNAYRFFSMHWIWNIKIIYECCKNIEQNFREIDTVVHEKRGSTKTRDRFRNPCPSWLMSIRKPIRWLNLSFGICLTGEKLGIHFAEFNNSQVNANFYREKVNKQICCPWPT